MWVGEMKVQNTGCPFLSRIKNRGVEDIMMETSVDGLTGFGDAIRTVFPQAEIKVYCASDSLFYKIYLLQKI